jgi:hypothetical protein
MRKFASMTANLVARKDGAAPPLEPERMGERFDPKPAPDPDRPRKLFVPLSHEEYERLSIAAAKTKSTPHQVVHAALEHYFHKLAADAQCQCIADVCTRGCAAN